MSSGAEMFSPDNQVLSLMHRHSVTPTAAQIPIFFKSQFLRENEAHQLEVRQWEGTVQTVFELN